jgi:hypothetical protein
VWRGAVADNDAIVVSDYHTNPSAATIADCAADRATKSIH